MHYSVRKHDLEPDLLTAERGRARQGRDLAQRFTELRYSFDQRRARQRPLPRYRSAAVSIGPASVK